MYTVVYTTDWIREDPMVAVACQLYYVECVSDEIFHYVIISPGIELLHI